MERQSLYTPTSGSRTCTAPALSVPPCVVWACIAPKHVASPARRKTTTLPSGMLLPEKVTVISRLAKMDVVVSARLGGDGGGLGGTDGGDGDGGGGDGGGSVGGGGEGGGGGGDGGGGDGSGGIGSPAW